MLCRDGQVRPTVVVAVAVVGGGEERKKEEGGCCVGCSACGCVQRGRESLKVKRRRGRRKFVCAYVIVYSGYVSVSVKLGSSMW